MVRLVPTADPEILLFAPADQLAQPTEQAKGKSVDPSKKKPATKKTITESSTSLQRQAEPIFPTARDSEWFRFSFLLPDRIAAQGLQFFFAQPPRGDDNS